MLAAIAVGNTGEEGMGTPENTRLWMTEEDLPAEKIMKIYGSGSKPMEDRGGVEENIIDLIEG
jgi:hypothetical protein